MTTATVFGGVTGRLVHAETYRGGAIKIVEAPRYDVDYDDGTLALFGEAVKDGKTVARFKEDLPRASLKNMILRIKARLGDGRQRYDRKYYSTASENPIESWKAAAGIGVGVAVLALGFAWSQKSKAATAPVQPGYVPSWKPLVAANDKYTFEAGQIYGVETPLDGQPVNPRATSTALKGIGLEMLDATVTPPHGWPSPSGAGYAYMLFTTETDKSFSKSDWGSVLILA